LFHVIVRCAMSHTSPVFTFVIVVYTLRSGLARCITRLTTPFPHEDVCGMVDVLAEPSILPAAALGIFIRACGLLACLGLVAACCLQQLVSFLSIAIGWQHSPELDIPRIASAAHLAGEALELIESALPHHFLDIRFRQCERHLECLAASAWLSTIDESFLDVGNVVRPENIGVECECGNELSSNSPVVSVSSNSFASHAPVKLRSGTSPPVCFEEPRFTVLQVFVLFFVITDVNFCLEAQFKAEADAMVQTQVNPSHWEVDEPFPEHKAPFVDPLRAQELSQNRNFPELPKDSTEYGEAQGNFNLQLLRSNIVTHANPENLLCGTTHSELYFVHVGHIAFENQLTTESRVLPQDPLNRLPNQEVCFFLELFADSTNLLVRFLFHLVPKLVLQIRMPLQKLGVEAFLAFSGRFVDGSEELRKHRVCQNLCPRFPPLEHFNRISDGGLVKGIHGLLQGSRVFQSTV